MQTKLILVLCGLGAGSFGSWTFQHFHQPTPLPQVVIVAPAPPDHWAEMDKVTKSRYAAIDKDYASAKVFNGTRYSQHQQLH